ncbi:MAG: GTPase HflX [Rickettsiales bacterium]|nr:GTPase HflX [Rickettsiales bacterium]
MGTLRSGIIIPYEPGREKRSMENREGEAVGLANAISLEPEYIRQVNLREKRPSTLFGKGTVDNLGEEFSTRHLDLIMVDTILTPIQQRNLETAWGCKVIDRTALILEIFGERARTKEGTLQVELASLSYQKSRLVRSWTHLERQRGGSGFMGGPGETQIESDRRMLDDRIVKLKKQLEQVTRTRRLQRESRRKIPYPIVALVGYTNAGKSTLFNRLTDADVLVEDQVFATLDPTLRMLKLPSGIEIILSDTVGFISNLPTELIAAFRATLEEVVEANLLLHIRDASDDDTETQKDEVDTIITELLGDEEKPVLEVLNKIDLMPEVQEDGHGISALNGDGVDELLEEIDEILQDLLGYDIYHIELEPKDGRQRAWLHEHAEIIEETINDDGTSLLKTRLTELDYARFMAL